MFVNEHTWQRPWFTQSTIDWKILHLQCIEKTWIVLELSFTNDVPKKPTLNFWQNFSTIIFFYICFLKLSDIGQGIHKHAIQKKDKYSAFFVNHLAKKKTNISVSRTTLSSQNIKFCMQKIFLGKSLFECKIWFATEIKFRENLKFLVPRSKKCLSYNCHIWELSLRGQTVLLCFVCGFHNRSKSDLSRNPHHCYFSLILFAVCCYDGLHKQILITLFCSKPLQK